MTRLGGIVVAAVAACSSGAPADGPARKKEPTPVTSSSLVWRSVDLPFGVTLDLPEGASTAQGATGEMRYFLHDAGPIHIGAWTGDPWSLGHWRRLATSQGGRVGDEQTVTVCGRPGVRQEAEVPAEQATAAVLNGDQIGHAEHERPALVKVALAVELAGGPVVIEWAVAPTERETRRPDEDRFFASIRCR